MQAYKKASDYYRTNFAKKRTAIQKVLSKHLCSDLAEEIVSYLKKPDRFGEEECILLAIPSSRARELRLEKCKDLCNIHSGICWIRVSKNTSYTITELKIYNHRYPTKWGPGDEVMYEGKRGVVVKAFGPVSIKIRGQESFWADSQKIQPYREKIWDKLVGVISDHFSTP